MKAGEQNQKSWHVQLDAGEVALLRPRTVEGLCGELAILDVDGESVLVALQHLTRGAGGAGGRDTEATTRSDG